MGKKMLHRNGSPDRDVVSEDNENIVNLSDDHWEKKLLKEVQNTGYSPYSEIYVDEQNQLWSESFVEEQVSPAQREEVFREQEDDHKTQYQKYSVFGQLDLNLAKNNNVPKLINREFLHLYPKYLKKQDLSQELPELKKEIENFLLAQKKEYVTTNDQGKKIAKKNINYTLDSLKKIFGRNPNSLNPSRRSKIIRRALFDFLRAQTRRMALQQSQIGMKKQYLIILKTMALRSRHHLLIGRTQIH